MGRASTDATPALRGSTDGGLPKGRGKDASGGKHRIAWKEYDVSCVSANDVQLARLANAIAQRVGQQRFHVWFNNSTKLDLRQDGLEIAVPNDFISEWIGPVYNALGLTVGVLHTDLITIEKRKGLGRRHEGPDELRSFRGSADQLFEIDCSSDRAVVDVIEHHAEIQDRRAHRDVIGVTHLV